MTIKLWILAIAIACSSLMGGAIVGIWKTRAYAEQEAKRQAQEAMAEASRMAKVLSAERQAREKAEKLEVEYHEQGKKLEALRTRNLALAARLREPSTESCVPGGSGASRPATGATATDDAAGAERLAGAAYRADLAAQYAATCYEFLKGLRAQDP